MLEDALADGHRARAGAVGAFALGDVVEDRPVVAQRRCAPDRSTRTSCCTPRTTLPVGRARARR